MVHPLKYAVVERERRFLVARIPDGDTTTREIDDRYVTGTRLRLREVREQDGTVVRKLSHKVRLSDDASEIACTNVYLDGAEWALLSALPGRSLHKRRHLVRRDGWVVAVDEHDDGTLVAEIDDHDEPSSEVPEWLEVLRDVTRDEHWTGARLAT
ncbi:hypothetical protein GCM10009867_02040 [Pedococcus aerophilus]|uniref:CYTH domain-containing protein n=1 Tax=Pedococcus aerophilus TaxID=436356 RepID=A0ABN3UH25_9MICO